MRLSRVQGDGVSQEPLGLCIQFCVLQGEKVSSIVSP